MNEWDGYHPNGQPCRAPIRFACPKEHYTIDQLKNATKSGHVDFPAILAAEATAEPDPTIELAALLGAAATTQLKRMDETMPKQPEFAEMPTRPVSVSISGTIGIVPDDDLDKELRVGDEITITARAVVRKVGAKHPQGGSQTETEPFATAQILEVTHRRVERP